MKAYIHSEDIDRIKALMEALDYDGNIELEIDESSGIGRTVKVCVPQSINSLKGTFTYIVSSEENW